MIRPENNAKGRNLHAPDKEEHMRIYVSGQPFVSISSKEEIAWRLKARYLLIDGDRAFLVLLALAPDMESCRKLLTIGIIRAAQPLCVGLGDLDISMT
jgi:hypothetical protein